MRRAVSAPSSHTLDARLLRFRSRAGSEDGVELAEALFEAGRTADAVEVASAGLARRPDDLRLLLVQGRGYIAERELLQAQASLLKAARAAPGSKEPFRYLGEVLLARGDDQRAVKVIERALKIDPSDRDLRALHDRARGVAGRAAPASVPAGTLPSGPAGRAPRPFAGKAAQPRLSATRPARGGSPSKVAANKPEPGTAHPQFGDAPEEATVVRQDVSQQLAMSLSARRSAPGAEPGEGATRVARGVFSETLEPLAHDPISPDDEDEPTTTVARDETPVHVGHGPPLPEGTAVTPGPPAALDADTAQRALPDAPALTSLGLREPAIWGDSTDEPTVLEAPPVLEPAPGPAGPAIGDAEIDLDDEIEVDDSGAFDAIDLAEEVSFDDDVDTARDAAPTPSPAVAAIAASRRSPKGAFGAAPEPDPSSPFSYKMGAPSPFERPAPSPSAVDAASSPAPPAPLPAPPAPPPAEAPASPPLAKRTIRGVGPPSAPPVPARSAPAVAPPPPPRPPPVAPPEPAPLFEPVFEAELEPAPSFEPAPFQLEDGTMPEDAAPMVVGDRHGEREDEDSLLRMLEREGLFEPPTDEAARWAPRKDVSPSGARVGRSIVVVWVLGLLLGGAGYYGWTQWTAANHAEAARLAETAWEDALRGDHEDLVAAERSLRLARDLDPLAPAAARVLLFVHAQRALEDGAFEPGYIRSTIALGRRREVDPRYVAVAEAVLAVSEGAMESASEHLDEALGEDDHDPALRYVAGRVRQRLGRDDAVDELVAAVEAEPRLSAAAIAIAEARADEGQPEAALEALAGVLSRTPDHLRARLWRAFLAADEDDPDAGLSALGVLFDELERGAPTDKVLAHLTKARLLRRKGSTEAAAEAVEQAAAAGATEPRLLALVAAESRSLGRLSFAQAAATNAVAGAPTNADFRKLLAEILLDRRDGVRALQTLEPLSGGDPDVLRLSARAALLVGTTETVQATMDALAAYIAQDEEPSVEMRALLLRAQVRLGQTAEALPAARELAATAPGDPDAAQALGEAALAARDPATATEALTRLTLSAPGDANAHYLLGRARRMAGDAAAAEQSLRHAIELSSQHTDASLALGGLLLDAGKYAEADSLYQDLARRGGFVSGVSTALMGRLGRVEALIGLGRVEDAAVQFEGVRRADRESFSARVAGARLSLAQGRPGEAISALRDLATPEHASPDVIALFAEALYEAGEGEAATDQFERVLAMDAGHPEALLGLARIYLRADRIDDAQDKIEELERSLERRTRSPRFRARMLLVQGRALLSRGRAQSARATEVLREAAGIDGAEPEVHFFLGEALSGNSARDARASYNRYLEADPQGRYAARARRAIQ